MKKLLIIVLGVFGFARVAAAMCVEGIAQGHACVAPAGLWCEDRY